MDWDEDLIDCPFCGTELIWEDAVRFGCTCGTTFYEEETDEIAFTPEPEEE